MSKNQVRFRGPSLWLGIAVVFLAAPALEAQGNARAAAVRALNDGLLRIHADLLEAGPSQAPGLRSQAASVVRERAAALSTLIESDASQALALAFSPELLGRFSAAFPQSASLLETYGTWQGTVEYLIIDDPGMTTHRSVRRMRTAQETLDVFFTGNEPAGLKSGDILRVSGMRAGTRVAAAGGAVEGSAVAGSACTTTGAQRAAVLLVTFPGVTPPSITPQAVYDDFFGTSGRSLNGYWQETSYNQTWAAGDVFGWYTLNAAYTCDQYSEIRAAAIAAADPFVNFQNYGRVFIVFPNPGSCSYAGLGTVGCGAISTADGSVTASTAWLIANYMTSTDQAVKLIAHEGGHNLGLMHSRSRDFGSDALGPLASSGTISEYGDNFSTMGYWNLGHYTAQQKAQLGWLSGANTLTVQGNGVFTLQPYELSAAGAQAIQVQRGTGNDDWLWLEYRRPLGNYDTALSSQVYSGALIHYHDSVTGSYTDLADSTPATSSWLDPALAAGQTWIDPYTNLSLSVQSATASGLTVAVNYGTAPCTAANPAVAISPSNPSVAAGASVSYTVTVTNNDSSSCLAGSFNLSSTQPSGWSSSLASPFLTINPGQSASTTLTQTPPPGTTPATYPISVTAGNGSYSGNGTANCTVTGTPPPLTVSQLIGSGTTSPSIPTYSTKATVPIKANVSIGAGPAAGASVVFTLTKPDGTKTTSTAIAGSTGAATWNYKVSAKGPRGTYSSVAQATYQGQTATSAPVSFAVQ